MSPSPASRSLRCRRRSPAAARESDTRKSICLIVEAAARDANLPLEFFARVIWQESRFQADAVGPMTRSGEHAQGIAQFMPGTASERGLLNPFNPVQALPKSAEFLNELRNQFGNLGLAAAAYNAGPRRVQEWLAGTGGMPEQTRNYVYAITGTSVDAWAKAGSDRQGTAEFAADELPRSHGASEARAECLRRRARAACRSSRPQRSGAYSSLPASTATGRWRCIPAPSRG